MRRMTFLALLSRAIALRPPGRRPKPTAKPFAPDTDALDDFFTQLDPDALVATAPEDAAPAAPAAEWSNWDAPATVETGDWVADAAPAFVPEGVGGPEWNGLDWESLEDEDAATELALDVLATPRSATESLDDDDDDELVMKPADDAELALDVLATPRSATKNAGVEFSHPQLSAGDAVEVLCEDDGVWYEATLKEVGLGICIADYGEGFEPEVVEVTRIRIPDLDLITKIQAVPEEQSVEYGEVDSHLLIERDKNGRPAHAGYTYVDEQTCVGCYNCAMVAPATFFMEDTYGSARVFHQHGDAAEIIEEAIDTCPVDCIHAVSFDELERLEIERRDQVINFAGRNMARAEGKNIMVASMTSSAGGRFSRVQEFEEIVEDDEFRMKAEAKAAERKQRAREDVERISGVRQTSVEL